MSGSCMRLRAGTVFCPFTSDALVKTHLYRYFLWDTIDAVINFIDLGFVVHGTRLMLKCKILAKGIMSLHRYRLFRRLSHVICMFRAILGIRLSAFN